jgi:threonine dehydrogenase-like Zn-dependent dehydrogenase
MKTTALRLYGKNDLRLETFELPEIKDDEVLANVTTNSICMSDYKAVIQGADHKRVTKDIAEKPIIIGHEQCGTILKVGEKLKDKFKEGMKYSIQPAVNYPGKESQAVGYSYQYVGGDATKIVIHSEIMEMNCLVPYYGDSFFQASLSEPIACILGALKSQYHVKAQQYEHEMGVKKGGNLALLGGAGPMGLEFLDILLHSEKKPKLIVLTDIDQTKLDRAAILFPPDAAVKNGVNLFYVNVSNKDTVKKLMDLSGNKGYDDIFVMVPNGVVVEQASMILGSDGCLNFFTGPSNQNFTAPFNFYNVHYYGHHVIGSVGSTTEDMLDALDIIGKGIINPAIMITHVGGLDSTGETILNLPNIPGGKKLIYTGISLPLVALEDFEAKGETDSLFNSLSQIIKKTKGIWSKEAEDYLLNHATPIDI